MRRALCLLALACAGGVWAKASAPRRPLPDLVVGCIEASDKGIVIVYGNQGPGRCTDPYVSLRVSDPNYKGNTEVFTLDEQPAPLQPLQVCRSQLIPWETLGQANSNKFASLDIDIDPRDEIEETQELNNNHYELVNGRANQPDRPDYVRYAGVPDLAIEAVEFVAPHSVRVKIVNRGKGLTLPRYCVRMTAKGLKNDLRKFYRKVQPLPLAGQFDYEEFDFRRWGCKIGESVPIRIEVDPDGRVRDANRTNNTVTKTLTFGPATPAPLPPGTVQGHTRHFRPRSVYATWVASGSVLHLHFFEFPLDQEDARLLRLNDAESVAERRATEKKRARYATLELKYAAGKLESAHWSNGNDLGRTRRRVPDSDVERFRISPLPKPGAVVKFDAPDADNHVRGTARVTAHPDVALEDTSNRRLPMDVPAQSVRGTARVKDKKFRAVSAFAKCDPAGKELTLWIFPVPLKPEQIRELRDWSPADVTQHLANDQLTRVQTLFYRDNPRSTIELCTNRVGLGGVENQGRLEGEIAPGKTVRFALKGRNAHWDSEVDIQGTVQIVP